jgi:hypothetical protein
MAALVYSYPRFWVDVAVTYFLFELLQGHLGLLGEVDEKIALTGQQIR